MINYKKGKKKYKINNLGSLYIDENKLNPNEQPIIYIGGQLEHRYHIIEQTGITSDPGHNMFTGSWFFDYPILSKNKESYNTESFTKTFLKLLKESGLKDVILISESYGGMLAAEATSSELVSKSISIHPAILGTPLANPSYMEQYKKLLTKYQRLLLRGIKLLINTDYGFEQDIVKGIDLNKVNLNKLIVIGNYLNIDTEQNNLLKETYEMIRIITSYRSDGVVIFEPKEFERLGINYQQETKHLNHFDANKKENIEEVKQKILK